MIQFRIYLRAELGKLRRRGDAERFVEKVPQDVLQDCGLPMNAHEISDSMTSQEQVDAFVAVLQDKTAWRLAEACSKRWRKNDAFDKLESSDIWREADVPIGQIELQQAEPKLGDLFQDNGFSLSRIATDERILAAEPYCHHRPGETVRFRTCLAMKKDETYRIFDGMHRAIQLVRNGEATLRLCYAATA
jgi:hypothetical protein